MSLLEVNGVVWELPATPKIETIKKNLAKAIADKAVFTFVTDKGVVVLINGATVQTVALGENQSQGGGPPGLR
jgi:hypothetical protein